MSPNGLKKKGKPISEAPWETSSMAKVTTKSHVLVIKSVSENTWRWRASDGKQLLSSKFQLWKLILVTVTTDCIRASVTKSTWSHAMWHIFNTTDIRKCKRAFLGPLSTGAFHFSSIHISYKSKMAYSHSTSSNPDSNWPAPHEHEKKGMSASLFI